jgi:hypothetical protein
MSKPNIVNFRCQHRHSALSHPQCYAAYLTGKVQSKGVKHKRSARIALIDIETLPGEFYAFDPKVEYLSSDKMIKDVSISCWAAKWLFEPEIMGETVSAAEAYNRDDRSILNGIWKIMDEADMLIFHNGLNFDMPVLYGRFATYGMKPPTKFTTVDTCKTSKSVFKFSYNGLDQLGQRFGIGKKIDMSFLDWKNCLTNDRNASIALEQMLTYCKNDIAPLLEDVYLAMLPYIPNHPNLGLWSLNEGNCCTHCESTDLNWNEKRYATPQGLWKSWRCNTCGSVGRGTGKENKEAKATLV